MKLKNCFIGQRVQVKEVNTTGDYFLSLYRGCTGTIVTVEAGEESLPIEVRFDSEPESTDWGHYSGLRKAK